MSHHPHALPTPDQARTNLAIHAGIYVVVNALLAIVDLQSVGDVWFHWPLLGWGAGLAWHAWVVHRHFGLIGRQGDPGAGPDRPAQEVTADSRLWDDDR